MAKEPRYVPLPRSVHAIDVDGLPEPVALALDSMVQALRSQLSADEQEQLPLLTRPGTTHRDIYRRELHG